MRSALVSVRDLARSVAFYTAVFAVDEVVREGEVAVLEGRGDFTLLLREVAGQGVHHGQQELGPRALVFDVGSREELDAVSGRLVAAAALEPRSSLRELEGAAIVAGRDPDGLPLVFVAYAPGAPRDASHFRRVAAHMYGVDL